jgi:gluconate 2-dehydrogenase gamma chain
MPKRCPIRRRKFLGAGLAAASGAAAVSCGGSKSGGGFRFFTGSEGATVDAICETLIPSDRDPGARAARVVDYIDIQLTRHFRKFQKVYRDGIAAVDAASRAKSGKRFTELTAAGQAEVIAEIEEKSKAFFDLILAHTRQGYYGDPRHGGNRGMVSWKMVGLPFPPVRGRMHYDEGPKAG